MVLVQSEFQRQRNSRHFDDSLSCKCCKHGVSLHVHLETHKQTHRKVHDARTFFQRDQWWKSHRQVLACLEFSIAPTGTGNVVEDMITDTEVNHMLKFGHQEDVRRDACNVGDETGFAPSVQLNNETLDFFTGSFEQDQGVLPRCE